MRMGMQQVGVTNSLAEIRQLLARTSGLTRSGIHSPPLSDSPFSHRSDPQATPQFHSNPIFDDPLATSRTERPDPSQPPSAPYGNGQAAPHPGRPPSAPAVQPGSPPAPPPGGHSTMTFAPESTAGLLARAAALTAAAPSGTGSFRRASSAPRARPSASSSYDSLPRASSPSFGTASSSSLHPSDDPLHSGPYYSQRVASRYTPSPLSASGPLDAAAPLQTSLRIRTSPSGRPSSPPRPTSLQELPHQLKSAGVHVPEDRSGIRRIQAELNNVKSQLDPLLAPYSHGRHGVPPAPRSSSSTSSKGNSRARALADAELMLSRSGLQGAHPPLPSSASTIATSASTPTSSLHFQTAKSDLANVAESLQSLQHSRYFSASAAPLDPASPAAPPPPPSHYYHSPAPPSSHTRSRHHPYSTPSYPTPSRSLFPGHPSPATSITSSTRTPPNGSAFPTSPTHPLKTRSSFNPYNSPQPKPPPSTIPGVSPDTLPSWIQNTAKQAPPGSFLSGISSSWQKPMTPSQPPALSSSPYSSYIDTHLAPDQNASQSVSQSQSHSNSHSHGRPPLHPPATAENGAGLGHHRRDEYQRALLQKQQAEAELEAMRGEAAGVQNLLAQLCRECTMVVGADKALAAAAEAPTSADVGTSQMALQLQAVVRSLLALASSPTPNGATLTTRSSDPFSPTTPGSDVGVQTDTSSSALADFGSSERGGEAEALRGRAKAAEVEARSLKVQLQTLERQLVSQQDLLAAQQQVTGQLEALQQLRHDLASHQELEGRCEELARQLDDARRAAAEAGERATEAGEKSTQLEDARRRLWEYEGQALDVVAMRQQLREAEAKVAEVESLRRRLREAEGRSAELAGARQRLLLDGEAQLAEVEALRGELDAARGRAQEVEQLRKNMEAMAVELEQVRAAAAAQRSRRISEAGASASDGATGEGAEAAAERAVWAEELEQREEKLRQWQQQLVRQEEEVEAAREEAAQKVADAAEREAQVATLNGNALAAVQQAERVLAEGEEKEARAKALATELAARELEVQRKDARIAELERGQGASKGAAVLEAELAAARAVVREQEEQLQVLSQELTQLEEAASPMATQLEEARQEAQRQHDLRNELEAKLAAATQATGRVQAELAHAQEAARKADAAGVAPAALAEIDALKRQVFERDQRIEAKDLEIQELRRTAEEYMDTLGDLDTEHSTLQSDFQLLQRQRDELQADLEKLRGKYTSAKDQLGQLTGPRGPVARCRELEAQSQQLRARCDLLAKEARAAQEGREYAEQQVAELEASNLALDGQVAFLRAELQGGGAGSGGRRK